MVARSRLWAVLGIIALGGVIVNNAIVLIDFINEKRKQGIGLNDSILQSCNERFRPILLTTATTVFGLLPTAYGEQIYQIFGFGGGDPFLIPIAISLGLGLGLWLTYDFDFLSCHHPYCG